MKSLFEILEEKGAYIIGWNTVTSVIKGEIVFANEAQLQATFDDYCKQLSMRAGTTIINLFKSPEKTSEVKAYIERLEKALNENLNCTETIWLQTVSENALASKPNCLKD